MRDRSRFVAMASAVGGVAAITAVYHWLHANPTTVALTYLVMILAIATKWGIAEATIASVLATLCFNVVFLPPVGTLTIADPENWVSFFAFMVTAVVASQLSGRARQRAVEAVGRQRDLERLYALSRGLLLSEGGTSLPSAIARRIVETFELRAVALYDQHTDTIARAGVADLPGIEAKLRDVARQAVSLRDETGVLVTAIRLGGAPIGSLAMAGAVLSDTVVQSIANLAAIGLERARGQEAMARAEAARQSGELRATVLDAVAHDFKTPLTSSKAAASALQASVRSGSREGELVAIIREELDRLQALVSDAVQMLRIDSGDFRVQRGRHLVADVVRSALQELGPRLDGHPFVNGVPPELTVDADRELLRLALRQLVDNAVKYSPPTSTIEIRASSNGTVGIAVRNTGSTIPEREQARIFERFYRGAQARHIAGTGMGLAIVQQIAQAHGGTLTVTSTADDGTTFTLALPREEGMA